MKKGRWIALFFLISWPLTAAARPEIFSKAVAYYLMADHLQARKLFDLYFQANPQTNLQRGFTLLFGKDNWETLKTFRDYLELDLRSLEALTGMSLALGNANNPMAVESYARTTRLYPDFSPAYVGMGVEYAKIRHFPAAEQNFLKARKLQPLPEYDILLARFYMQAGEYAKALAVSRPAADTAPDNFHFNILTAEACLLLQKPAEGEKYIDLALDLRPNETDALLLKARFLARVGEWQKARTMLQRIRFAQYNPEYGKTMAEVLLALKSNECEKYLYEAFSHDPWDPRVNLLMTRFHQGRRGANIRFWLERAGLAGCSTDALQAEFPGQLDKSFGGGVPFFDIKRLAWLAGGVLAAAGRQFSGEGESLYILSANDGKILKSFPYTGSVQKLIPSPDFGKLLLVAQEESENVRVYALSSGESGYSLRPLHNQPLPFPTVTAGFNRTSSMAYITDGRLAEKAFESPFSTMSSYNRAVPIYPLYPFAVYSFNFVTGEWKEVRDTAQRRAVPLPEMRQYFMLADAYRAGGEIGKMIQLGQTFDSISGKAVRTFLSPSRDSVVVYYSDTKDAFQALISESGGRVYRVNSRQFLDEGQYAEIEIVRFDPENGELLLLTSDKQRALIRLMYRTGLYHRLQIGVMHVDVDEEYGRVYVMQESTNRIFVSDTNAEVIQFSPFLQRSIPGRKDLAHFLGNDQWYRPCFATYHGEILKLEDNGSFTYGGVAPVGAPFAVSPDKRRSVAFIGGRVHIRKWIRAD